MKYFEEDTNDLDVEVRAYSAVLSEQKMNNIVREESSSGDESSLEDESEIAISLKEKTQRLIKLPWIERLDVVSKATLGFNSQEEVHDDLKREVVFYDCAIEAVNLAKQKFQKQKIPFHRPDDFFCEMVKSDDHMNKIKDRLVFESKKISAFEQRKANKENKLRSKELKQAKILRDSQRKKQHFNNVEKWASNYSNEEDNNILVKKKRHDTRKRWRNNDKKSLNDFSGYNPRFGGSNSTSNFKKRPGKRSRDANKSKIGKKKKV